MADNDATVLTGIDLLRQRRDALLASASAPTMGTPNADPATELVEPIDYPSGPLAWSQSTDFAAAVPLLPLGADELPDADEPDAEPAHDDGRRPLSTVLLVLLVVVAAGGVALAAMMFGYREARTTPRAAPSAPPAATAPVAAPPAVPPAAAAQPPAPPAQHVETDDEYLERALTTGSVVPPITGMDTARAQAHALCTYLDAAPRTEHELYRYTLTVWPAWTAKQRGAFAGSAINAYCGQYDNLPD